MEVALKTCAYQPTGSAHLAGPCHAAGSCRIRYRWAGDAEWTQDYRRFCPLHAERYLTVLRGLRDIAEVEVVEA